MRIPYPLFLAFVALFLICNEGYAHSGGTDAQGGHHDRKNGGYHYHNGGSSRSSYHATYSSPSVISNSFATKKKSPSSLHQASISTYRESKKRTAKKERIWVDNRGQEITRGKAISFNSATGELTILNGSFHKKQIEISELSAHDQAYFLDIRHLLSRYRTNMAWSSADGEEQIYGTAVSIENKNVILRLSSGKLVKVELENLDQTSQINARELLQAQSAVVSLLDQRTASNSP